MDHDPTRGAGVILLQILDQATPTDCKSTLVSESNPRGRRQHPLGLGRHGGRGADGLTHGCYDGAPASQVSGMTERPQVLSQPPHQADLWHRDKRGEEPK